MKDEQEALLLRMVEAFEKQSTYFAVAVRHMNENPNGPKWFTPKRMFLNFVRILALSTPKEIQMLACAVHGTVDVLGFSGAVKLVLDLRRKNARKSSGQDEGRLS